MKLKTFLINNLPSSVVAWMGRKITTLTEKERSVKEKFEKTLEIRVKKTERQFTIAMVGLVGAGKSSVANRLAEEIGAVVISADAIRVELRKLGEKYDNVWLIAESIVENFLGFGYNIIIDSDFIEAPKRASLRTLVRKKEDIKLLFLRVHADEDIMLERALIGNYAGKDGEFFRGARSLADESVRGAVVKIREMHRRAPLHYSWEREAGGKWKLRKLDFVCEDVDTTTLKWHITIARLGRKLRAM